MSNFPAETPAAGGPASVAGNGEVDSKVWKGPKRSSELLKA